MFRASSKVIIRRGDRVVERNGDKGLLSTSASKCGKEVVWRLKRGNEEDVMVLKGMGS